MAEAKSFGILVTPGVGVGIAEIRRDRVVGQTDLRLGKSGQDASNGKRNGHANDADEAGGSVCVLPALPAGDAEWGAVPVSGAERYGDLPQP